LVSADYLIEGRQQAWSAAQVLALGFDGAALGVLYFYCSARPNASPRSVLVVRLVAGVNSVIMTDSLQEQAMDIPTREDLIALSASAPAARVSVYLPTHRYGPDTQQDSIRLKNLLRQSEDELVKTGLRRTKAKDFLAPGWVLQEDPDFWQTQSAGLALFLDMDSERHFRVPIPFAELAVVAPRFHLKPLLPLLAGEEVFHVLALSMNETRLLECTPYAEDEVSVPDMPRSMADVLWADDPEKQLQFRSFVTGAGGVARFHGAGGSEPDPKDDLLRYFREVDRALAAYLSRASGPLVLACVEYLAPIYHQANSYARLVEGVVPGNPEELRPEEIRESAWEIVRPLHLETRADALASYRSLAGTGKTTSDVAEAALAAMSGRVELALVAVGVQRWGLVDVAAHIVHLHPEPEPGDQDLLDFVAIQTLLNGGKVYALAPDEVPEPSGVAAVFRY
jgi:hypothetical protein